MTRRFWLIVVLIASFLPWPASQQLFLLAFTRSVDNRLLDSSDELLEWNAGNNIAWLDQYFDSSQNELMVLCECEQELNECESADGSAEYQCESIRLDWDIDCKILDHESCLRRSSDFYRLTYPVMKSRIVCRC